MKKYEFLKKIRLDNGLSRPKISRILGVSVSYLEKIETGHTNITPTTNYVQGICALYGYNPDIFNYDDITPELLEELELSKFSKSVRKYLYFSGYELYKGENINAEYINFIIFDILKITSIGDGLLLLIPELVERLKTQNIIKNYLSDITLDENDIYLLEMFILIGIEKFKPSEFGNIANYIKIIDYKDKFIKKWDLPMQSNKSGLKLSLTNKRPKMDLSLNNNKSMWYDKNSPLALNGIQLKEKLLSMEKNGLELNIDTIKYTYKYIKYKNLENEVKQLETELNLNPAEVTNPKIKEICDLLEYAPDTFKDKIIQKLNEYKQLEDF